MAKKLLAIFGCFLTAHAIAQANVGIGTTLPINKLEVVSTVTGASSAAISATNTANVGIGIYGISHAASTTGVQGTSNFGVGVYGYSNTYIAVGGGAINGTAIYASSVSGTALEVVGKVKLSGGNTNPSNGAVLTSDASGNAVWKPKRIGFSAHTAANTSIPISTFRKVEFSGEDFDHENNFVLYAGTTTSSTSVFTVPVAGIYQLSSSVLFESTTDISSGQIRLVKNSSGNVLANSEGDVGYVNSNLSYVTLEIGSSFHLDMGDKVWVEVAQRNIYGNSISLNNTATRGRFSAILRLAD